MAPDDDPASGFARAVQTMAETQRMLAESQARIEQTTQYMAGTQRLGHAILAFQCVMIGFALVGLGFLIWLGVTQSQEHAALTRALLDLVQRSRP
jgi:hypothetical protein